jgi:hypothetical protein
LQPNMQFDVAGFKNGAHLDRERLPASTAFINSNASARMRYYKISV